jgi:tetratricopeptide (TPR) repeat protein
MKVTPVIPDGYNGPIKQLTCRICKHMFYITQDDYRRFPEVRFCHECSLIMLEELQKSQTAEDMIPPPAERAKPVVSSPARFSVPSTPAVPVPQPRTIDRDKMTIEQLLEEAKMLRKTWRYQEALRSYEEALQRDPTCLAAWFGKGEMLRNVNRPKEALAVYDQILHIDPISVKAYEDKGWTLISLRRYEEALASFDYALQIDPSAHSAEQGKDFILTHIFHHREHRKRANTPKKRASLTKTETKPCQSARDYFERGCDLFALNRDDEAFRAFTRSLELDPLDLDVYEHVSTLYGLRGNREKSLALYDQALHLFPECARLHERRADTLLRLERYQQALEACNQAIQFDKMRASAYRVKGEVLHHLRRFQEAIETFDLAIHLEPDNKWAYKHKAEVDPLLWSPETWGLQLLLFKSNRADILKRGMSPDPVIEGLDILEDGLPGFCTRLEAREINAFAFERSEERL